jgi:hypothetical protein
MRYLIFAQEIQILFLKCVQTMMLHLASYVFPNLIYLRLMNGKCAVAALPFELQKAHVLGSAVPPFQGYSMELLQIFAGSRGIFDWIFDLDLLVGFDPAGLGGVGLFGNKAGPGYEEYEDQDQGADNVILQCAPLVSPDQDVPERSSGFRHLTSILPSGYRRPSNSGS